MASIKKIHCLLANFDLDLRNERAVLDLLLELRLDTIALRLWAIDLTGLRAVREVVDVVTRLLLLLILGFIALGIRRKFDGYAVIAVANCMDTTLMGCHRVGRWKDDGVFVIYRPEWLPDDESNGVIVIQPTAEVFKLDVRHALLLCPLRGCYRSSRL